MSKRKYNKFKCLLIGVVLVLMSRSIYAKMDTKDEDRYEILLRTATVPSVTPPS